MSRRRVNVANNIAGPSSALTAFLRESGITATSIAQRAATRNAEAGPSAGPSSLAQQTNADDEGEPEEGDEEAAPRPGVRKGKRKASGYGSEDMDEAAEEEAPAPKMRKLTKAAEAKLKAKAKKAAGKKKGDGSDDEDDEDRDAYTALSKSAWTAPSTKPPVGTFEPCATCEKQFTVTTYTLAAKEGPGWLCHKCAKSTGVDPFAKKAPVRKRAVPADKRKVVHYDEKRCPTLASLCIDIISSHIDDVDALGAIGAVNMENIAKALAKNRRLTPENVNLFYDVQHENLILYDATRLTPAAFCTLGMLNPNLTALRLDLCGCMDDTVINAWCTSMPNLTSLELLGPFLVRVPGWISFFEAHPKMTKFLITQSPRFDFACMESLVTNCPNLTELRLKEVGKMDDSFVDCLKRLKNGLTLLDLSDPSESISEEALLVLIEEVGGTLTHLDLSKHDAITDKFLEEGLKPYAKNLTSLAMNHVLDMTDEGVGALFSSWDGSRPLTSLDLSKNPLLGSLALKAILSHSGNALFSLNINAWKDVSEEALAALPVKAVGLRKLDIGWCRAMTDFILQEVVEKCEKMVEVKVWGCNRVTGQFARKRPVAIYGLEK